MGVIGCGSAGPAVAALLARAGHEVEVFERAPELLPVGTGFVLQPTGQMVLERLGMRERVEAYGARILRLHSHTASGRVLLDLVYERLVPGVFGLGMHRATLLELLVDVARREGSRIRCGVEIEAMEAEGDRRYLIADGDRHGPFDLVIVANGARSEARKFCGVPVRAKRYPWGALWTIAADPERRFANQLYQVVDGTHTMLGFLGTGVRVGDRDRTPLVSLFWSVRSDRAEDTLRRGPGDLADRIVRLAPDAEDVVGRIGDTGESAQWSFAEYMDVVMPQWHGNGCVVLGDAAHAMSPQLGQGVNLALWDAWILAECLDRSTTLAEALSSYTNERRAHLGFYQFATRWLTPLFQSSIPPAGWLRDLGFPILGAIAPIERQMLRSMAGLKRGLLRESLPLPGPN